MNYEIEDLIKFYKSLAFKKTATFYREARKGLRKDRKDFLSVLASLRAIMLWLRYNDFMRSRQVAKDFFAPFAGSIALLAVKKAVIFYRKARKGLRKDRKDFLSVLASLRAISLCLGYEV